MPCARLGDSSAVHVGAGISLHRRLQGSGKKELGAMAMSYSHACVASLNTAINYKQSGPYR